MKTVVALWHSGDKGKTETLRDFANLLIATYPTYLPILPSPAHIPTTGDFQLVVKIKGKIIGIVSQGDPNTGLETKLVDLAKTFHCDIILCSTRTKGDTVKAVEHLCSKYSFDPIWTSTYQVTSSYKLANQTKAEHILDLLQKFSLI